MEIKAVEPARKLYPWKKWADGKPHEVRRGKGKDQFACSPKDFRDALHVYASRERKAGNPLRVKTAIHGNSVQFQFTKA